MRKKLLECHAKELLPISRIQLYIKGETNFEASQPHSGETLQSWTEAKSQTKFL
jgi:hypothetical protein